MPDEIVDQSVCRFIWHMLRDFQALHKLEAFLQIERLGRSRGRKHDGSMTSELRAT